MIISQGIMRAGVTMALALFACIEMVSPYSASAQEVTGTMDEMSDESRYQLKQQGNRFVRLDQKTGQMSVCRLKGDNLVCRMAADDRDALVAELDGMQDRIAALEENAKTEAAPKSRSKNESQTDRDGGYPLDKEIDEAVEYSGRVIRKFFDVMKELRQDLNR